MYRSWQGLGRQADVVALDRNVCRARKGLAKAAVPAHFEEAAKDARTMRVTLMVRLPKEPASQSL